MDISWEDLRTVLCLVRCGSLAAAASELGVSYTTVSRRVSRAEAALGLPLFERLADGYRPTEHALLVAEHTGPMDGAANDLMRKLRGRDPTLSGPFVVTAPQLLIAHFLAPALDQFCKAHPGVALKVRATNELLDLNRREADLALRISRNPGDNLKGLRLSEQHTAGFATPAMAEQLAADPSAPVDWLVYAQVPGLPKSVRQAFPNARIRMEFDDMVAMIWAAQAGLGAVRAPMFLGRNVPGLVQIPHLDPQPYADVWIVGHPDIWASAKSMAFREIMVRFFRAERAVFLADPPA